MTPVAGTPPDAAARRGHDLRAAALLTAGVAALLMWPVLRAPHHRVFGHPSDPLAEVWRLEQFRTGEIGLLGDGVARTANAPDGIDMRRAVEATQVLYDLPAWALVQVLPAVPVYNLLVWVALWTSGLATAWALVRLGVRVEGAITAGVLFMVVPVHMIEAELHVALALTAPLPVLLMLGVSALRRPRAVTGAVLGAATAACAYVTAYLALEALALVLGLAAAALVVAVGRPARRAGLGRAALAAVGAGAVVAAPLAVVLATSRGALDAAAARPASDLALFALAPADVVDRGGTAYLGLVMLPLALAGLVRGRGGGALRLALAAVTIAGLWLALSPQAPVVGALAPAEAIHAVVPYWRVYGRVEVVAALGVACLAGLAVARLAERPGPAGRGFAAVLAGLATADLLRAPPPPAADLGRADPVAAWLAGATGRVAEFPVRGVEDHRFGTYLFRQTRHGRPLLNGGIAGTGAADLAEAAAADGGRQALPALRLAGVDRVAVHAEAPPPPGLAPGPALPAGAVALRVPPGEGAVALARGAYPAEPGPGGATFRWLGDGAHLRVIASCPGVVTVRMRAVSAGVPRRMRVGDHTVPVATAPTGVAVRVRLPFAGGHDLPVRMQPPPAALAPGDPRVAGVGVYEVGAAAACADRP
ncbi:MAG TPA: hypothetical protein VNT51_08915 [Miltoncostaeaceae bacterium]|nr:hypothetical protein [Miltoncostaeaceae bacterium]